MKQLKLVIDEIRIGRVLQHGRSTERAMGIISAFRSEYSHDQNIARSQKMASELRQHGFGYSFIDGEWTENPGTPDETRVKEDSIFIMGKDTDDGTLKDLMGKLATEYDQEAFVYKPKESITAKLIFQNGDEMDIGQMHINTIGDVISRLKNKPGSFTFEGMRFDSGWIDKLIEVHKK